METASNDPDRSAKRKWAMQCLQSDLRELAANLMRIAAGAGKTELVGSQARDVVVTMLKLVELGDPPSDDEIKGMLDVERDYGPSREARWERAIDTMMRGGLRMAAGQLLNQGTQRSNGEDLMLQGLTVIEQIRAGNTAASQTAARQPRKPVVRRTKR